MYRFADLVLDVGRRELKRDGVPIELGRLTFALLTALVDAAPNVLGHDAIIERVWNGRATSPETVTQRVKLLRDALSDDAEQPRYIGLVRGQGYRLLPPCTLITTTESISRTAGRAGSRPALLGAGLSLVAILAASILIWRSGRDPAVPRTPAVEALPASIAVLPFENLSADGANAYFAVGLHDTLLSELATISGLNVIARSSVERYTDRSKPLAQIASELRVATVMVGSVQFDGNAIRLTASLIDPQTGAQIWARTYDRSLGDVFAMETEIAVAITEALEARLLPSERRNIESPPTTSAAAFALYMETRVDTDRRRLPLDDDRNRLPLLDRAIALDPNFAAAYVARAEIFTWAYAYSEAGSDRDEIARRRDYERRALDDAARALEIDPSLPGPWVVRGILDLENWRWEMAEADFRRALELGPNDPDALLQYAFFETYAGRLDEAIELAQRRLAIDPLSVESSNGLGFIAIVARDPATAIERYAEVERLAPGIWFYYATRALAYLQSGDRVRAEMSVRKADELRSPGDIGVFLTDSAIVYRWLGMPAEAQRAFAGFEDWTRENLVSEGDWTLAYLGIGDHEKAFESLQRAVAKVEANEPDSHQALALIAANAIEDAVLEEPRFRELRSRLLPPGDPGRIVARRP